jgi:predicted dehydrogenase
LITVVTPHNTHAELALKALNAGKHVVVEKPMCLTTDEATRMIDAASANSVVLSVYHNRRYDGDFLAMKDVIDRGLIGDIFQIQAGGGHFGEPGMWWRSDKTISGGILYDWGAHFIDWILRMMPDHKAVQVTGFLHHLVWTAHTSEDHGKVIIRFDNGASAELTQSSISAVPMPRWRIQGTKGGLLDDGSVRDGCKIFSSLNGITMSGEIRWKPSQQNPYYKALFAHIATGAESPVTGESARRVISIIESAEKSSNAGRSVALPFG